MILVPNSVKVWCPRNSVRQERSIVSLVSCWIEEWTLAA